MLRLRGSVYCRSSLARPWKLHFEEHDCMVFHALESGQALLELGQQQLLLSTGDFVLLPKGTSHSIRHPSDTQGARVPNIRMFESDLCRNEIWSDKPETVLLCGTFHLSKNQEHFLLAAFPEVLYIANQAWLAALLQPMALEVSAGRLGANTILKRMTDVLFVQVVRHYLESGTAPAHWLVGLHDQYLARALQAIHNQPANVWTVQSLADCAGLSRSSFAARFEQVIGQTPLDYLTHWRMTLASTWLQEPRASILDVANRAGYQSEVAFYRAFKRTTGQTPGSVKHSAKLAAAHKS